MSDFEIIAKTQFGLEDILADEIKSLGGKEIETLNRAVRFKGDKAILYKSNLHLRTALRVLKPIASFNAFNDHKFYNKIRRLPWENWLSLNETFAIDAITYGDTFRHSKFVALRAKDAIADKFMEAYNERPSVNTSKPDLSINIHISDKSCSVSIDSSGESLDKRGYRLAKMKAPINEVLAAGIILSTDWDKESEFIDGMCGSGTLAIEAALIKGNYAPGRLRSFAFEKWKDFDPELWKNIKDEAKSLEQKSKSKIQAFDISKEAVMVALENMKTAGVNDIISVDVKDFLKSESKVDEGIVVLNPPYGERLNPRQLIDLYKEIGTRLKHFYKGHSAWIISSNLEALKLVGLRPSKKIKLFNGSLECRLNKYELYDGSKKKSALTPEQ